MLVNWKEMRTYEKIMVILTIIGITAASIVGLYKSAKQVSPVNVSLPPPVIPDSYNPDLQNQTKRHYNFTVDASKAYWQTNDIIISNDEEAIITTYPYDSGTNCISIYSPSWGRGTVGAAGYTNVAGSVFRKANAPEGCLLMKTSDGNITPWTNNIEQLTVTTAGQISFSINDDMTGNGHGLSTDYGDNTGAISVSVVVLPKQK
jgi:hypothetical protein